MTINTNAGNDQVTAAPGTETVMAITLGGGLGNDILTGNVLNLFGDEGMTFWLAALAISHLTAALAMTHSSVTADQIT